MILKALKYPNRNILVVRKVQADLRNSCFKEFIKQLEKMKIIQYCKYTTSYMKIEFPNGSEIIFLGLEDPERIKSISGIDDIMIEEATELTLDDFLTLNLRLRSKAENQQIHILFNPTTKANWVYKFFFEEEQENCVILKTTYKDNKFLPQDFINALLSYEKIDPHHYKVYALGEFGTLDKTVFSNWKVEPVEDKGDLYIGLDFGFSNDPTAVIGCYIEGSNLFVVDEIYKKGMFIDDIANELKRKGWNRYDVFCDSAEPRSIQDLKRQGIKSHPVKKGKDSILHGIGWLQNMNIIIDPKCKNLIEEMKDLTYMKNKDGIYINKINSSCRDHALDALRYATEIIRLNKKVSFMDKKIFGL